MSAEIIACPVCGETALDESEPVYRRRYKPVMRDGVMINEATVFTLDTMRCRGCGRLFITGDGSQIDSDLIAARQHLTNHPAAGTPLADRPRPVSMWSRLRRSSRQQARSQDASSRD